MSKPVKRSKIYMSDSELLIAARTLIAQGELLLDIANRMNDAQQLGSETFMASVQDITKVAEKLMDEISVRGLIQ